MIFVCDMLNIALILSHNAWHICYVFIHIFYNCYSIVFDHFSVCSRMKWRLRDAAFEMCAKFSCFQLYKALVVYMQNIQGSLISISTSNTINQISDLMSFHVSKALYIQMMTTRKMCNYHTLQNNQNNYQNNQ